MDRSQFEHQIYAISDSPSILKTAIDDGAEIVQLRDKSGNINSIKEKAFEIISNKKRHNFLFIINDHPELVVEIGADGVHIGQDTSTAEIRKIVGPSSIIGKTTHSLDQAKAAERDGADYISAGPVFETPTKPGRKAVGLEYVKAVAENIDLPFVAIGGIDLTNIDKILESGAKTIGIVRAASDVKELLCRIQAKKQ